jgi:hypothetical protein
MIQIDSRNLKSGYRIIFDPGKVDRGFVLRAESQFGLVLRHRLDAKNFAKIFRFTITSNL